MHVSWHKLQAPAITLLPVNIFSLIHMDQQMVVQLEEVRVVSVVGLKTQFKIPPHDAVIVGDEPFIRLNSQSWTLQNVVWEQNEDAPIPHVGRDRTRQYSSLANCIGLNTMLQLRNEAQAQHLAPAGGSTLFQGVDVDDNNKKKKTGLQMTKLEMKSKRNEHVPITIDINMDGTTHTIEVLRPVHAKDALYVKYDAETLRVVLQYMRQSGFTEMKPNIKHQGAAGIQKDGDGFRVVVRDDQGQKRYKKAKDLDDAVQILNNPNENGEDPGLGDGSDEHDDVEISDGGARDASGDEQP